MRRAIGAGVLLLALAGCGGTAAATTHPAPTVTVTKTVTPPTPASCQVRERLANPNLTPAQVTTLCEPTPAPTATVTAQPSSQASQTQQALPPGVTLGPSPGTYYVDCFTAQCTSLPSAGPFGTTCGQISTGEQLCQ